MAHACKIELWLTSTGTCDGFNVAMLDHARDEVAIDVIPLTPALDAHHALERATTHVRKHYGFDVPLFS